MWAWGFKYWSHSLPRRLDEDDDRLEVRKSRVTGLGIGWTRVTGRRAPWRASVNGVNASPLARPFLEYLSTCSSGNSSRRCSPSFDRRQRERFSTNQLSTWCVFMLPNDLRSLCHLVRSNPLRSPYDQPSGSPYSSEMYYRRESFTEKTKNLSHER